MAVTQPGRGSHTHPMTQNSSFLIELPIALKPWAAKHADRQGLPSPENYILLLVRRAWQEEHLQGLLDQTPSSVEGE
jgi:hypothetical protein